jgi:hypothetical protein
MKSLDEAVMSMMMWRLAVDKTVSDIGQPGVSIMFCRRVSVSVGLISVAVAAALAVVDAVGTAMDGDSRVMRFEGLRHGRPVWRHGGGWWWWWWWLYGCAKLIDCEDPTQINQVKTNDQPARPTIPIAHTHHL